MNERAMKVDFWQDQDLCLTKYESWRPLGLRAESRLMGENGTVKIKEKHIRDKKDKSFIFCSGDAVSHDIDRIPSGHKRQEGKSRGAHPRETIGQVTLTCASARQITDTQAPISIHRMQVCACVCEQMLIYICLYPQRNESHCLNGEGNQICILKKDVALTVTQEGL